MFSHLKIKLKEKSLLKTNSLPPMMSLQQTTNLLKIHQQKKSLQLKVNQLRRSNHQKRVPLKMPLSERLFVAALATYTAKREKTLNWMKKCKHLSQRHLKRSVTQWKCTKRSLSNTTETWTCTL